MCDHCVSLNVRGLCLPVQGKKPAFATFQVTVCALPSSPAGGPLRNALPLWTLRVFSFAGNLPWLSPLLSSVPLVLCWPLGARVLPGFVLILPWLLPAG